MATLQYDFSIINQKAIERAFASIEKRAATHNARMSREFGGKASGGGRSSIARDTDQLTRKRIGSELSAERAATREKIRLDKWRQDIRNRHFQQEMRERNRAELSHVRSMARAQAENKRAGGAIFGRATDSVRSSTRAVGTAVGGALAIGGGFAASAAVSQQMRETAMASQLANQSGSPMNKGAILKESQGIKGFSGEEAMAGMGAFTDLTGDLGTARKLMADFAELSLATGSSLENVAASAGNFANNLKHIEDPGERAAKIMESMRALAGQGRAGAIELKDLASGGARLGAVAGQFAGDATENIKKAGVIAQVTRTSGGAASPEQALTAVEGFTNMIATKADKLEAMGVNVGTRDSDGNLTQLSDPRELIAQIMEKTGGDLGEISKLFGEQGKKALGGFQKSFLTDKENGVKKEFDRIMGGEMSKGEIKTYAASRLSDPDLQFKEASKQFSAAVGSELLPAVTKLIPELTALLPHVATAARIFGKLVESLAENPLTTIGSIIAAKMVADVAAAQIGNAVKSAITGSVSGAGISGALSGALANGLTLGAGVALAIYSSGVVNFEQDEAQMDRAFEDQEIAKTTLERLKSGEISKEEAVKTIGGVSSRRTRESMETGEENKSTESKVRGVGSFLGSIIGALATPSAAAGTTLNADISKSVGSNTEEAFVESAKRAAIINDAQVKTNESIEKTTRALLRAAEAFEAKATGKGPTRPAAETK